MKFHLRIRPRAIIDVNEAAAYIASDSVEHALRSYEAVDSTYRVILRSPSAWPLFTTSQELPLSGLRRRAVTGFANYLVLYCVDGQVIDVVRVIHAARDLPAVLARDIEPEPE